MLKELAAAAALRLWAPKLRGLRAFHVQCPSLTPAGVALFANGRHPLLLRGLPATEALPGVPRKAPLCSQGLAWHNREASVEWTKKCLADASPSPSMVRAPAMAGESHLSHAGAGGEEGKKFKKPPRPPRSHGTLPCQ